MSNFIKKKSMDIEVLFFGITADIIGEKSILFEVSNGISVLGFRQKIVENYPKLSAQNNFSIAVNMEYAEEALIIKESDIVALIPPVSGG